MNTISFNPPVRLATPAVNRQPVAPFQPTLAQPATPVTFGGEFGDAMGAAMKIVGTAIAVVGLGVGAIIGVGTVLAVKGCNTQNQVAPADQTEEIKALKDQIKALEAKNQATDPKAP